MSIVKEKKMASAERPAGSSSFFQNLLLSGIYKRKQGRITRQVTFFAIVGSIAVGASRLPGLFPASASMWLTVGLPTALVVVGGWIAYRLVNMPNFADFLIAVEAEMSKVSWPTRMELIRGSTVVLVTIVVLAVMLFLFDMAWYKLFHFIGVQ